MPAITKIEKLKSTKVRRAKLYYIRGFIGKAAKRLKKEKEDAAVWEDVIADEVDESQNGDTDKETEEAQTEEKPEEAPEKAETAESEPENQEPETEKKETKKESKDSK